MTQYMCYKKKYIQRIHENDIYKRNVLTILQKRCGHPPTHISQSSPLLEVKCYRKQKRSLVYIKFASPI
jgi:hypothetical protein